MELRDVESLLTQVAAIDRHGFTDGALETWYRLLANESADDVQAALDEIARRPDDDGVIRPGVLRSRARVLREARERRRRQLTAAAPVFSTPSAEYRAFRAQLDARIAARRATQLA